MLEHAIDVDGQLSLITRPVTVQGVQITKRGLDARSAEWKAELGIYEVVRETVPEGYRAGSWALTLDNGVVTATPEDLQPIPPEMIEVTLEQIAELAFPHADDGAGLVVGQFYEVGRTVVVDGDTYDVIQPFLYASSAWQPEHLRAHLVLQVQSGDPWVQPAGGHDAYAAGAIVTHNGKTWENTHGDGNVWEPGVFGWAEIA